ncbi:hypothetical protein ACFL6I_12145 [candidate division KSB1 bacterium]
MHNDDSIKIKLKSFFLILFEFLFITYTNAQEIDTVWYSKEWKETIKNNAKYYRIVKIDTINNLYDVIDYYKNGNIQSTGNYQSLNPEIEEGIFIYYSRSKLIKSKSTYKEGVSIKDEWYRRGKLTQVEKSKANSQDTILEFIIYRNNGVIKVSARMVNNVKDGLFFGNYRNGNMKIKGEAIMGKLKYQVQFYKNGNKKSEIIKDNTENNYQYKKYNRKGILKEEGITIPVTTRRLLLIY